MQSEFAYAKLQHLNGEEHFIHTLPALIASKRAKEMCASTEQAKLEILALTNIPDAFYYHALIFEYEGTFKILSISPLIVDGKSVICNQLLIQALMQSKQPLSAFITTLVSKVTANLSKFIEEQVATDLRQISKIFIESQLEPEIYYFCVPTSQQRTVVHQKQPVIANTQTISKVIMQNNANGSKWSNDDHQQLKKLLLQYGYGRWKQIQRSSSTIGGKLDNKPLPEIKAYANSFLRALGLSLPEDETNLKIFLQKLIQQNQAQFLEYQPNLKEWDQHIMLPQRSIQYTKRLQLLYRVKTLIHKYREDSLKNMSIPDRRKVNWDGLLNFIPLGLLFGQRPAVWWAKKNDIDLLLGVYKYGYANYVSIRNAREYCFVELERAQNYQDFPVADNLTRRLKKLINTLVKIQLNQGEIDFEDEAESEEDEKTWSDAEKKALFAIVSDYGVPIGTDNKSNWTELKDKMKSQLKEFAKSPSQVEKMVSRIRWNCQEIISEDKDGQAIFSSAAMGSGSFKITFEMAAKFSKNINLLEFIRRSILLMEGDNLKLFLTQVQDKSELLSKDHPAFIQSKISDHQILLHANRYGVTGMSTGSLRLTEPKLLARLEWLCQVYKAIKEKVQDKKKKYKTFDQSTKKKAKFELNKDKDGNIRFPININPSLILVATGTISTNPNYHSEHNLFPIGYISIRSHASMFTRGQRARYTCEILEGDGKPIYKVVPEEDPHNPIIKDSSTGCWVYICNRVNQLQEVKKEKVTISGTERFGLLEPNVVRLLEDLPEAEKCLRYKFKKNLPKEQ